MCCVTSINVFPKKTTINVGEWYEDINIDFGCAGDCCSDIVWYSDNPCVASVNAANGRIYGISAGTARIYATVKDECNISDYITVTVNGTVHIASLAQGLSVRRGDCAILTADILPKNATEKGVVWSSDNECVATVHGGAVHGVSVGTATVTATSKFNSKISASCKVRVTKDIPVTYISVSLSSASVVKDKIVYASEQIYPHNATCKCVTWESSDTSVASVNPVSGTVFTHKAGTVTIRAKAQDGSGVVGEATLTVKPPVKVTSVTVCPSSVTVNVGSSTRLNADVYPYNAQEKRIRWSSENCNVADVDPYTGCVCGKSAGTTYIYANAQDGSGVSGYCEVTVRSIDVTGISFSEASYTLEAIGATKRLYPTVYPNNATNKSVTWSSSDSSVVSVNQYGHITAVSTNGGSVASAIITATTSDGGFVASCTVNVDTREKVTVSKDGNFNKITFASGKVWRCINCDMINNDANAQNNTLQNRLWENTYANIITDDYGLTGYYNPISYTDNEIKLIYTIDPYGLAAYVNEYAKNNYESGCSVQEMLEGILGYKDYIFELLYKRSPKYYARNSAGNWFVTTNKSNLMAVVSESEYLFGFHALWDTTSTYQLLSTALDLLVSLTGADSTMLGDWITKIAKIGLNLWVGKAPFELQDIVESIVGDAIEDEITDEISSWANYISLAKSLGELQEVFSDRPQLYSTLLDFSSGCNNQDINYNIIFNLVNGQKYSAIDLYNMI